MTVTKHEVLFVTTNGDDPQSIIDAMRELPKDATFVQTDGVESIHGFGTGPVITRITFEFRREVTNE